MGAENFSLQFSVLSEKIQKQLQIITLVNMEAYNHLLLFVCGLYMATATLLNGHLYTGVGKHFSFYTEQSHFYYILTYLAYSVKKQQVNITSYQARKYKQNLNI